MIKKFVTAGLAAGALAAGGMTLASPAFAGETAAAGPSAQSVSALTHCHLYGRYPVYTNTAKSRIAVTTARKNCTNEVTYFSVRMYRVQPWYKPDTEEASAVDKYAYNGRLTAHKPGCGPNGRYYNDSKTLWTGTDTHYQSAHVQRRFSGGQC